MDGDPIPPCPILDGCIQRIKFSIATPKEIKTTSINDCSITHASQLMNPFLGLPLESGKCESCGTFEQGQCEGHFGFIELPVPVFHPCHVTQLRHILSLICLKCLRMKKCKVRLDLIPGRTKDASCPYCRGLPPISVNEFKTSGGATALELKVSSKIRWREDFWNFLHRYGFKYGDTFCRPLLPIEILRILKRIPDDTKRRLAAKGYLPQPGYILQFIPVPPNCLYVPDISDGKSSMSNDVSIPRLKKILYEIDHIKRSRSGSANFQTLESESNQLQSLITQYMNLRGTKKAPFDNTKKMQPATDSSNLSAKQWLEKMRSLFISKGSGYSSRSVISGDAYKGANEIGIPSEIAKKITFEERVTSWNLNRLQDLVDSRQCLRYVDGSYTYSTEEGSKGYTHLRIGQVVHRRIMNGDIVFVNRPPTTHKHALQAFSVYIHDDRTVKINPLVCAPFGADFDGDCIHIFYPQSLAAKAEVLMLFGVEQQLCSSHSGNLNMQLVNDSLLALKVMHKLSFIKKDTAQQLGMFTSPSLPPPAIVHACHSGPLWTVFQILANCLPAALNCSGDRFLIRNSEILKAHLNGDSIQMMFTDIASSILVSRGPQGALNFFSSLQSLLMEVLFINGFSISIRDFYISEMVLDDLRYSFQEISAALHQLRSSYNELICLQVESFLKRIRSPIVDFILYYSSLGDLVDVKSESALVKVVQQLGFVGLQLFVRGKLYSRSLVDHMFSHYLKKYSVDETHHPSEAYGLIKNSFFHGLNPFEEMVHSISTREVIIRSTRGLAEPGTLFKNLMAILRDIAICYDGTVRNVCSNSIVQFEYEAGGPKTFDLSPPGEPVGVLAATAISNPAYKAVLDSSQSTNSSWELMKEVLLSKVNFSNDAKSRRVILYLEDCLTGGEFYKEKAAFVVQSCLRKVTLKECATEFSIIYQNQIPTQDDVAVPGLIGHIHLDERRLNELNRSVLEVLQKCQDAINFHLRRGQLSQIFKHVAISASDCCSCNQPCDAEMPQFPCLQFWCHVGNSNMNYDFMEKMIDRMANLVYPILLDTIIKGDPRIHAANITWIDPESAPWVKNSLKKSKGEVAIEVVVAKDVAKRSGDAWRIALDASIPVMHLIDIRRSTPYDIKQIQYLLGISCAFDQTVQRLSTAIKSVSRGVLKEHLMLVAHSMTCTGNVIGFNTSGYKAFFRSLNIQVPFTEATLVTPMKCFERAAERCHSDSLSSMVASSLWGKNVAIGTGACFQIIWNQPQEHVEQTIGKDVYDFLHTVRSTAGETVSSSFLGVDVDELAEENGDLSPEHDLGFGKPTFDDDDEVHVDNAFFENLTCEGSGWKNNKISVPKSDGWSTVSDSSPKSDGWEKFSSDNNGWKKSSAASQLNAWERSSSLAADKSEGWTKFLASGTKFDSQKRVPAAVSKTNDWNNQSTIKSDTWEKVPAPINKNDWEKNGASWSNVHSPKPSEDNDKFDSWSKVPGKSNPFGNWNKDSEHFEDVNSKQGRSPNWNSKLVHDCEIRDIPNSVTPTQDDNENLDVNWNRNENQTDWDASISRSKKKLGNNPGFQQDAWADKTSDEGLGASHGFDKGDNDIELQQTNPPPRFQPCSKKSANNSNRASHDFDKLNDDREERQTSLPPRFQYWNAGGLTVTNRRLDSFTSEEKIILDDVEPIMKSIKKILHDSRYNDGDRLSEEDQTFVLEKVFPYHPNRNSKISGEIGYVMVDRHTDFTGTRCFFVVSSDESRADFSYIKCVKNFVKENYEKAETFCKKYFPGKRPESQRNAR